MRLRADRPRRGRVVDDDVRVGADRDRPLPREHPEELGRRRRNDLDPAFAADPPGDHAAVVEQVDAVLDARQTVRDLAEVTLAEVLLAFEIERAVVGRDELEVILHETRPQLLLVIGRSERRRADELRPVETALHVVERQEEVLRAGLGERRNAAVARIADRVQGVACGEMDDVDRHAGRLGQADHPVRRLALEDRIAGDAVVVGIGVAGRDLVGGDDVDRHPVLGVHHDQTAVLRGPLHRPEDRAVVAVEDARVGGEQLEVRHALGDEAVHLGQRVVVDVAHDHVEAVVGDGVALGLGVPCVQPFAERLAARLDREVDDRRRPPEGGRARARLERVLGERPAERELHVRVDVDRAGNQPTSLRVDRLVGADTAPEARPDLGDGLAVDQDIRRGRPLGRDDRAVRDQRAHRAPPRHSIRRG